MSEKIQKEEEEKEREERKEAEEKTEKREKMEKEMAKASYVECPVCFYLRAYTYIRLAAYIHGGLIESLKLLPTWCERERHVRVREV